MRSWSGRARPSEIRGNQNQIIQVKTMHIRLRPIPFVVALATLLVATAAIAAIGARAAWQAIRATAVLDRAVIRVCTAAGLLRLPVSPMLEPKAKATAEPTVEPAVKAAPKPALDAEWRSAAI